MKGERIKRGKMEGGGWMRRIGERRRKVGKRWIESTWNSDPQRVNAVDASAKKPTFPHNFDSACHLCILNQSYNKVHVLLIKIFLVPLSNDCMTKRLVSEVIKMLTGQRYCGTNMASTCKSGKDMENTARAS